MPSPPDHNAGINALPKFVYDPLTYDRKAYADFKNARALADQKRVADSERALKIAMKDVTRAIMEKMDSELAKAGIEGVAGQGRVLEIDTAGSTCFASVTWEAHEDDPENGTVTGVFRRDNSEYSGELSLDQLLSWADDPSPGGFYNATKPF
jgi:hypothetical protein